jgi:hypothetical protein
MRMTFATEKAARVAAGIFEQYGYGATRMGTIILTDCPTLLAVPVVGRAVGFERIEGVHLVDRSRATEPGEPSPTVGGNKNVVGMQ